MFGDLREGTQSETHCFRLAHSAPQNCQPPCDSTCSAQLFQLQLSCYPTGTVHYYVDPYSSRSSDGATGLSQTSAWATIQRGLAQLRFARVSLCAAPTVCAPGVQPNAQVQLWLRDPSALQSWRAVELSGGAVLSTSPSACDAMP